MERKDYFDLTGDVAIVTGASSGLGVQFAKALANQGAKLALIARRKEKLEAVQKEIEDFGAECRIYPCDLTDTELLKKTVAQIAEDYGKIDILVNNAGLAGGGKTIELEDERWLRLISLNLNAVFFMAREVAKVMTKQQYGRIINLGSIHSTVALKGLPIQNYSAAKGGVLMLTKSLASELALEGITVNAIGPAYFDTEMTDSFLNSERFTKFIKTYCPMERPGRPGELDTTLLYYASHYSTYVTGQISTVDGGWTSI